MFSDPSPNPKVQYVDDPTVFTACLRSSFILHQYVNNYYVKQARSHDNSRTLYESHEITYDSPVNVMTINFTESNVTSERNLPIYLLDNHHNNVQCTSVFIKMCC